MKPVSANYVYIELNMITVQFYGESHDPVMMQSIFWLMTFYVYY